MGSARTPEEIEQMKRDGWVIQDSVELYGDMEFDVSQEKIETFLSWFTDSIRLFAHEIAMFDAGQYCASFFEPFADEIGEYQYTGNVEINRVDYRKYERVTE
jgi:hypothetical protein